MSHARPPLRRAAAALVLAGLAAVGCGPAGPDGDAAPADAAPQAVIQTSANDQTAIIRIAPPLLGERAVYDAARAWSEGERDRFLKIGGPRAAFESTWTRTFANARFVSALGRVKGGAPGDAEALAKAAGATLDKSQGRLIALREIWRDDRDYGASARVFAAALEPLALEAARKALDQRELDANVHDMIAETIRPDFTLYPGWALAPSGDAGRAGGLIVVFPPYTLAGVGAELEVLVPIDPIRAAIRPDLLDQFVGGAAALDRQTDPKGGRPKAER